MPYLNPIEAGVFLDPKTGKIQVVEKTGEKTKEGKDATKVVAEFASPPEGFTFTGEFAEGGAPMFKNGDRGYIALTKSGYTPVNSVGEHQARKDGYDYDTKLFTAPKFEQAFSRWAGHRNRRKTRDFEKDILNDIIDKGPYFEANQAFNQRSQDIIGDSNLPGNIKAADDGYAQAALNASQGPDARSNMLAKMQAAQRASEQKQGALNQDTAAANQQRQARVATENANEQARISTGNDNRQRRLAAQKEYDAAIRSQRRNVHQANNNLRSSRGQLADYVIDTIDNERASMTQDQILSVQEQYKAKVAKYQQDIRAWQNRKNAAYTRYVSGLSDPTAYKKEVDTADMQIKESYRKIEEEKTRLREALQQLQWRNNKGRGGIFGNAAASVQSLIANGNTIARGSDGAFGSADDIYRNARTYEDGEMFQENTRMNGTRDLWRNSIRNTGHNAYAAGDMIGNAAAGVGTQAYGAVTGQDTPYKEYYDAASKTWRTIGSPKPYASGGVLPMSSLIPRKKDVNKNDVAIYKADIDKYKTLLKFRLELQKLKYKEREKLRELQFKEKQERYKDLFGV